MEVQHHLSPGFHLFQFNRVLNLVSYIKLMLLRLLMMFIYIKKECEMILIMASLDCSHSPELHYGMKPFKKRDLYWSKHAQYQNPDTELNQSLCCCWKSTVYLLLTAAWLNVHCASPSCQRTKGTAGPRRTLLLFEIQIHVAMNSIKYE